MLRKRVKVLNQKYFSEKRAGQKEFEAADPLMLLNIENTKEVLHE